LPKQDIAIFVESTPKGLDRKFLSELIKTKINVEFLNRIKWEHNKDGNRDGVIADLKNALKEDEYLNGNIKTLLIIVDADEDLKKCFKSVQDALYNRKDKTFNIPKKLGVIEQSDITKIGVGVFLLPDCKEKGSLETLCLQALKHTKSEEKMKCVENYFQCLNSKKIDTQNHNHASKSKFRVFMATPNPDKSGGYTKNIIDNIDFNSTALDPLAKFLKSAE
jgi:hypothetical protein